MKLLILFTTLFLTWVAYDFNLLRRRRESDRSDLSELSLVECDELQQKKRIERRSLDVVPTWLRKRKARLRLKCNYFSTKPRDGRFSDQKKIRRMFNNM